MTNKKIIIFNAVIDLIKEQGIHTGIKISDIAKRANIGKGTVYEYFVNKDELLVETAFHIIDTNKNYIVDTESTHLDFVNHVEDLINKVLTINYNISSMIRYEDLGNVMDKEMQIKIHNKIMETQEIYLNYFKTIVQKGIEENLVTQDYSRFTLEASLMTLMTMCINYVHTKKDVTNVEKEQFVSELTKLIIKMLA
jgi:AcrR family transcriptional regulator